MRSPIVAGSFYPSDFGELDKSINDCFIGKLGPGSLPSKRTEKKIAGAIVPHAGYQYSGQCAAWAYKEIAESEFPQIFIILGNDHSGIGEDCVSTEDWLTPLGIVKTDKYLAKKLIDNSTLHENNKAHYEEHSIEVQLPFLLISNKDHLRDIKIVAVMVSSNNYKAIAERISRIINESKKKVCIICSSDFTHYGPNYGFVPFKGDVKENLYELDKKAISFINKFDTEAFLQFIRNTKTTICGSRNIAVMIELCKNLGAQKAELLRYYTSGDIVNDYSNAVGYASIIFY
ncbi:AmmeMemoRadiSam system protein B [Candidatus Woesearchaeota archaeon]|nr:AmmeMemoRadiSam system protein B [Candidatus Woesearchaeota archaeon]MBW3021354.1 AmmeMemoRadiSam system protein B [Candidatus Woesearchaeota archaeon]